MGPLLEGLRNIAGQGMGRVVLENSILLSEDGERGSVIVEKALALALTDRAARCMRQVEEHYGLDSRAVGGLMAREMGDRLIRVRLGSKPYEPAACGERHPFTSVPYKIRAGDNEFIESTARSRGFKFALISGLAAYLVKARIVIVPESGQGALGPALVTVGQSPEVNGPKTYLRNPSGGGSGRKRLAHRV